MIEIIDKIGVDIFFGSNSAFLDNLALLLTNVYTWIPMYIALFVLIIKNNDNMQQILLVLAMIALCVFIASGTANLLVKPLVARLRPCNDIQYKYLADIAGNMHEKSFSFFSSHAANTMSVAVFFTLLVRGKLLSTILFMWSFLNMWTRLYLGQHFLTDILVGMVWGIFSAFIAYGIFYRIYKNISSSRNYVSSQYTVTGYSYIDMDVVASVFFLILCIAALPLNEIYHNVINYIN